jgi:ELWxxDGT repeat protein
MVSTTGRTPLTNRGFRRGFWALALLASMAGSVRGEVLFQVADINQRPPSGQFFYGSSPTDFFVFQGKLFFFANGWPWVSDGTDAGTRRLIDAGSGAFLGVAGGGLLFATGTGLWRTDGTRAGTIPLTDSSVEVVTSHEGSVNGQLFLSAGGRLFFIALEPDTGMSRPWVTDGTPAGTFPLIDTTVFTSDFSALFAVGSLVYFATVSPASVWATDGTLAGTKQLGGLPNTSESPPELHATDNQLFIIDASGGVWVTDKSGTAVQALDLPLFPQPGSLIPVGTRLFFTASDGTHGDQLWVTDGTIAGTHQLTAFAPRALGLVTTVVDLGSTIVFETVGASMSGLWTNGGTDNTTRFLASGGALLALGSRALYVALEGSHVGVYSTDGTITGTVLLGRGAEGPCTAGLPETPLGVAVHGVAYFAGFEGTVCQIVSTDGTLAATHAITDMPAAVGPNDPYFDLGNGFARLGNEFLFAASGNGYGRELWKSNGAPGGTRMVTDLSEVDGSSDPQDLTVLGDKILFTASDGAVERLWVTDGTAGNVTALTPADSTQLPAGLIVAGKYVFFWESGVGVGQVPTLLRTDGTQAGTMALHAFPDPNALVGAPLVALGSRVFFPAHDSSGIEQLWVSDGSPSGTMLSLSVPDASPYLPITKLAAAGGKLYFVASAGDGNRIYVSDGTPAGTSIILTGNFNPALSPSLEFTQVGSLVFFVLNGSDLWRTDGTQGGTGFVASLPAGVQPADVRDLIAFNGNVYYFATTVDGRSLVRSDGTAPGTRVVRSFPHWAGQSFLTSFNGRLFFVADDGIHGSELWTSDGTTAGTQIFVDLWPGPTGSSPSGLAAAAGQLFFAADDGVHGSELWASDGTSTGTHMVEDLAPGANSSSPDQFTQLGPLLLLAADDGVTGRELWALPLNSTASCSPSQTHLCLLGGRFEVEARWRDFQGREGGSTASQLTSDTGAFAFFDASNLDVVVKLIDGRGINQSFWVFYGALSNVEYTLTIVDTVTGLSRHYFNPLGQLASVADTNAFGPLGEDRSAPTRNAFGALDRAENLAPVTEQAGGDVAGSCQPGPGRLCLQGRFAVTATWGDFAGHKGEANAVSLTGDSGYLWFFSASDVEVILKIVDGRAINGKFWLFYGALSNVQYRLTVTDTATGRVRHYVNPLGDLASVADTGAF